MPDELIALTNTAPVRRFQKGSTILHQGEVPRGVYIIKSGTVKVFNLTTKGDEQIITFNTEGELFPTPWLFGKTPSVIYFYEANETTELYVLEKGALLQLAKDSGAVSYYLMNYYATAFSAALIRINALEQFKADKKVHFTLFYLCQRFGTNQQQFTKINLRLTQYDLAALTGLTRETVSVEINKLKRAKIVYSTRGHYFIALKQLIDLLGDDSLEEITL